MNLRAGALWLFCLIAGLLLALDPTSAHAQSGTIGLNFTGVTQAQGAALNASIPSAPPDSDGAVGPNNIVQLINGVYAVYDKAGNQQQIMSADTFWTSAGVTVGTDIPGLGTFNNRILYDPVSQHWFAAAVTSTLANNDLVVARSNTSNPADGWKAVQFLANNPENGAFSDFTRLGINANGVYVGVSNFTTGEFPSYISDSLFSIPKSDLLLATPSVARLSSFIGLTADQVGNSPVPIINFSGSGNAPVLGTFNAINSTAIFRADIAGGGGANAQVVNNAIMSVNGYSPPPLAAQPDGTRLITTIDSRFTANVYQVGDIIYAAHAIGTGGNAAVEWFKINATTNAVIQEGIISSANFDYFQPAIAANANGDIVMSFTRSGLGAGGNLSDFAIVGKTVGDVTTFGDPFLIMASPVDNYHDNFSRWGDYTTMQVDPTNPNVFWTFEEYADSSDTWATLITQITVPEPSSIILSAFALAALLLAARRRGSRLGSNMIIKC